MNLEKFNVEEGKEYIYLVMVEYKDKTLLKIGYTKTLDGRMDTYELHNPDIKLLSIREGTRDLENYLHKKFEKYAYPKRKEWFYYDEEIIEGFDILEEKFFLDVDLIKSKIYNLLKPKSVDELKSLYYEKYGRSKDISLVISRVFSFLNKKIEEFINSLDYSVIPIELELNSDTVFIIQDPISLIDKIIDYKRLFGIQLREKDQENIIKISIKTENRPISKEFYDRFDYKKERSNSLLSTYFYPKSQYDKDNLAEVFQKVRNLYNYRDDYIDVITENNKLIPIFNREIMESEERAFELYKDDYIARFNSL